MIYSRTPGFLGVHFYAKLYSSEWIYAVLKSNICS